MVGFGIGHNLEKNLKRAEQLRADGKLDKALRQLQEWARRHPETPHYQYEAAQVAFDKGDWTTGLTALRGLMRALPDTRERVLRAVEERYADGPVLPLAEFLAENLLPDGKHEELFALVARLPAEELALYRRKLQLRHQSLLAAGDGGGDALLFSHLQLMAAAAEDGEPFAEHCEGAGALEPSLARTLAQLARAAHEGDRGDAWFQVAHGRACWRNGDAAEGARHLSEAARRLPGARAALREWLGSQEPADSARPAWHYRMGDLALLEGDGEAAANHYREAADRDAKIRAELLGKLRDANDPATGTGELRKLQLRLQVVLGEYEGLAELHARMLDEGLAKPQELRSLMGERRGESGQRPGLLNALLAGAALKGGDLAAAAQHIHAIGDEEQDALESVREALEEQLGTGNDEGHMELVALHALLLSRLGDHEAANEALADLWEEHADELDAALNVTRTVASRIAPTTELVLALLPPAARAGEYDLPVELLARLLRERGTGGIGEGGDEGDLVLDRGQLGDITAASGPLGGLDLGGGNGPDLPCGLDHALVRLCREEPACCAFVAELLRRVQVETGACPGLRWPSAVANLRAGAIDAALSEFAVLLMAAPDREDDVLDELQRALAEHPDHPGLNRGAGEILLGQGALEEAATALARALAAPEADAGELCRLFDRILEESPDDPALWDQYGAALFAAGRFDALEALLARAEDRLPEHARGELQLLRARVALAEGRVPDALGQAEALLGQPSTPAPVLAAFCEELAGQLPHDPRAHQLHARAALRAGRLDTSLAACHQALRHEPALAPALASMVQDIVRRPEASGAQMLEAGRFHLTARDEPRATAALDRALRLDPALAGPVRTLLAPGGQRRSSHPTLLAVAARAAEMAGDIEAATRILVELHEDPTSEPHVALAGLRELRQRRPSELGPARALVATMAADGAAEAAVDALVELAGDVELPLRGRRELLAEFATTLPGRARLCLAECGLQLELGDTGAAAEALRRAGQQDDFEPEQALLLGQRLLEHGEQPAALRLQLHDWLAELGQAEPALDILPDPHGLDDEGLAELVDRLQARRELVLAREERALRLAAALELTGQRADAIAWLEEAVGAGRGPSAARLGAELARLRHAAGDDAGAAAALADACDGRDPDEARRQFADWTHQRRRRRVAALEASHARAPGDDRLRLELATARLDAGDDEDIPTLLAAPVEGAAAQVERATLMARHWLGRGRATEADGALRAVSPGEAPGRLVADWTWLRAQCAELLGRPEEAIALYDHLRDDAGYGEAATRRARGVHSWLLAELAGEHRGVLRRVGG